MTRHVEAAFEGRPASIALARRFLMEALAGLPTDLVDDAMVCVSELATNAVRHSASGLPGGKFRLVIDVDDRLRLAVLDDGGPTEPVILPPSEYAGGWGLPIITRLGSLSMSGGPEGRCVAALLPLPGEEVGR